jgi:energy-coupling factor transport system permease protein
VRATAANALDRAIDVAATLELRGYGSARRAPRAHRPWSRHDLAFAASAGALVALAVAGELIGATHFEAYPRLQAATGPGLFAVATALVLCALAPFLDRRGIGR